MIPHFCFIGDEYKALRTLVQGTDAYWQLKEDRRHFVSASEVPTICGFGWKTAHALFKEKLGLKSKTMDAYTQELIKHGQDWEAPARQSFSLIMDYPVMQTGIWVHPIDQRLSASPDGLVVTPDGLIPLEIKCPNTNTIVDDRRRHKDSLQLQTQIQCVGAPYGFLFYFFPDFPELCEIICYQENWEQWMDIVAHSDWFISCVWAQQFTKANFSYNRVYYMFLQDEYFKFLRSQGADNHRAGISPSARAAAAAKTKRTADAEGTLQAGKTGAG